MAPMGDLKTSIIGYGTIGKAVHKLFPDSIIYSRTFGNKREVNKTDFSFICVPTNELPNGQCDTSIVEEVVSWASPKEAFICLSTVEIGTTERLVKKTGKRIVFQPEYFGEGIAHPLTELGNKPFVILGGKKEARNKVIELYQTVYNSNLKIYQTDSRTAEVIKYMENSWLATKVTFFNDFYDLCETFGVNYNEVREGFLHDSRVTPSHTFVYPGKRGWSGKCLPKDTAALCYLSRKAGRPANLIEVVRGINTIHNESS